MAFRFSSRLSPFSFGWNLIFIEYLFELTLIGYVFEFGTHVKITHQIVHFGEKLESLGVQKHLCVDEVQEGELDCLKTLILKVKGFYYFFRLLFGSSLQRLLIRFNFLGHVR